MTENVLKFLHFLYKQGISFSLINRAWFAFFSFAMTEGFPLGKNETPCRCYLNLPKFYPCGMSEK